MAKKKGRIKKKPKIWKKKTHNTTLILNSVAAYLSPKVTVVQMLYQGLLWSSLSQMSEPWLCLIPNLLVITHNFTWKKKTGGM